MTPRQQCNAFSADLDALISRYRSEFDMQYVQIIGILQLQVHELSAECLDPDRDDQDETPE